MKRVFFFSFLSAVLLSSCMTYQGRPSNESAVLAGAQHTVNVVPDKNFISESLFADKKSTISEESIQAILDGQYRLPNKLRIGIVHIENKQSKIYGWADEEYLKTQEKYIEILTDALQSNGRVEKIFLIPRILISSSPDFTMLREAAVRTQTDIVLVFTVSGGLYTKYKLFKKDDIKAFATTQLVLMDIRTGLIPFTEIITRDYTSQQQAEDMNESGARQRIQDKAALLTMEDIGKRLIEFLNKVE